MRGSGLFDGRSEPSEDKIAWRVGQENNTSNEFNLHHVRIIHFMWEGRIISLCVPEVTYNFMNTTTGELNESSADDLGLGLKATSLSGSTGDGVGHGDCFCIAIEYVGPFIVVIGPWRWLDTQRGDGHNITWTNKWVITCMSTSMSEQTDKSDSLKTPFWHFDRWAT